MAKLYITNIHIDKPTQSLRVDLQFKDEVQVENTARKRKVFANETHYFIVNLPEVKEDNFTHSMPQTWLKELRDLLDMLEKDIKSYLH